MPTIKGWYRPSDAPQQLIARGPLYSVAQHYVPELKSSAACIAPSECVLCERTFPTQHLIAVPVSQPGSEVIYLLRILTMQHDLIARLQARGDLLVGTVLQVEVLSRKNGVRLGVKFLGHENVRPAPVTNYIAAIGQRTYREFIKKFREDLPGQENLLNQDE